MKKNFDAHKIFTTEINAPFADLLNYIQSKESNTYMRHQNLQLATFDWRHDLIVHMERSHEEVLRSLESAKAVDILKWAASIRTEIQSRGPSYWQASDDFFESVLNSSLKDFLTAKDFESIYEPEVVKWVSYITKLSQTKKEMDHDIEILEKRKNLLQGEVASAQIQVEKMKKYLKDLGDLKNAFDRKISVENQIKELEEKKRDTKKELDKLVDKSSFAKLAVQTRAKLDDLFGSSKSK